MIISSELEKFHFGQPVNNHQYKMSGTITRGAFEGKFKP